MAEYTQEKVNELLYNAWVAYRECIHYADLANEYPGEDEMFDIYERMAIDFMHEAQTWLKAWSVMTDIEMSVAELSKFKESDFEVEPLKEEHFVQTPLHEMQFQDKGIRTNY